MIARLKRLREAALSEVERYASDLEYVRLGLRNTCREREKISLDPQTILVLLDAVDALRKIMHARRNPGIPLTNMSSADMRELAGEALAALDKEET